MAEDQSIQTQTDPQLIMWDKENGVFRPARLKMPEDYVGSDLERNVELEESFITVGKLHLVSSVYLGQINIYEESLGSIGTRDIFERLRLHKHGIACHIVALAEEVAKQQRIPYFGVTVVKTEKDRTWKFEARETMFKEDLIDERYTSIIIDKFKEPQKPLEFVLHPTAQLYVLIK